MRQFLDDYAELEEFDESSFESFAATRRLLGKKSKLHQKDAGRRRRGRAHHDRWADDDRDSYDDSNDYHDYESDRYQGLRFDD
ncbi:MAG: hypothetical protein KJO01_07545 [Gammaproteobacteria bacterium]|nr:hypothetical protein [Gammaproteobacteria bacterium]MBT8111967.1 hypothetical protein [Gammaproteobacteria bacterium]NND48331.1 hypothetical protein [Woeseiaceae bacterium]NNL46667.1 hypothetical protein [Woeseiaceae bacterium]